MKYLSRNDLEAIGNRVIAAYSKLPEVATEQVTRVDIDYLVGTLLGLQIDYQHWCENSLQSVEDRSLFRRKADDAVPP